MMPRHRFLTMALLLLGSALVACQGEGSERDGSIRASGFLEGRTYTIASVQGGRVVEVPVSRGDPVAAGEVVVRLDEEALLRDRQAAQAALNMARANLEMVEGQPRAGDRSAAEAALAQAEAEGAAARAARDLLVAIYDPADPPDQELHAAETAVRQADARVALARARLDQVMAGPPEGEVLAARAGVEEAEAGLRLVELQLKELAPVAPIDGEVEEVLVRPGEVAPAGAPLMAIIDPDRLILTAYVPQQHLGQVGAGDLVEVTVDAYPGATFSGRVIRVASRAQFTPTEVQTREDRVRLVFAVEIQVEDASRRLTPGMPADVVFVETGSK